LFEAPLSTLTSSICWGASRHRNARGRRQRSQIRDHSADVRVARSRPLHRALKRIAHLILECFDAAVPGPWPRVLNAKQRQDALRRAERAIAQIVIEAAIRVAVRMTAMATHPGVVRSARVVKEEFAALLGRALDHL